ncbi:MAG TPA: hypothetical protein VHK46_06500 [Gaiellaceae bacterium]|jgi:hypothetical protein|nr:hypothetical protein [Gaiellaceae bacterium]
MDPKARFGEIVDDLVARDPDVEQSQMMGRPSIKAGGKLIACLESRGTMAFKLPDEAEQEKALALDGARVYEPADNGRKMGGWIEVPQAHEERWAELAETALRMRKENA